MNDVEKLDLNEIISGQNKNEENDKREDSSEGSQNDILQENFCEGDNENKHYNEEIPLNTKDSDAAKEKIATECGGIYGKEANFAVENDWLDLSYVERKYVEIPEAEKQKEEEVQEEEYHSEDEMNDNNENNSNKEGILNRFISKIGKKWAIAASFALIIVIAALCAFTIGGVDAQQWWSDVRREALDVFGVETPSNKFTLSAISTIDSISGGDIVISGGSLAITFTDGVVKNVTDTSVTIEYSDDTQIVYSSLKDIQVVSGQVLSCYDIIGYYDEMCIVNIFHNGKKVENVVEIDRTVIWEV